VDFPNAQENNGLIKESGLMPTLSSHKTENPRKRTELLFLSPVARRKIATPRWAATKLYQKNNYRARQRSYQFLTT